ncbi:MAG TPA: hypothetical protein VHI99_17935 [Vicinamibacterales bacterium]|jgi:hypothetical protein|nr:hypothetical protein [Vicinamibacterales bacterium]
MVMAAHNRCPLCEERKARRECPALEQTICSVCCGTKRLVEIRCPPTCPYLSSAQQHPAAVVQRRRDRDMGFFLPLVSDLSEGQYRLMIYFQAIAARHAVGAVPTLMDQDVAEAAAALAGTLETAGKGIIYEHQAASIPAQRLVTVLRQGLTELTRESGAQTSRLERDAAVALRRLEHGARTASSALEGEEHPVFLSLISRMMATAGQATEEAHGSELAAPSAGDRQPGSGLIIPG